MKTKWMNANSATFCVSALELEDSYLKGSVTGQHNPAFIFGREVKFEKTKLLFFSFNVCGSVHHASIVLIIQQNATSKGFILHFFTLYMFQVTIPPIIRSTIAVSATSGISRLHCNL